MKDGKFFCTTGNAYVIPNNYNHHVNNEKDCIQFICDNMSMCLHCVQCTVSSKTR